MRYWFDQQATKQTLSGTEIDCSALTTGVHFVHFQIICEDGTLTPVRSQAFLVMDETLLPSSDYSRIKYWFDKQTAKQTLSGTEIDCSALNTGIHFVHLQVEGADGMLCPVQSQAFLVIKENLTPSVAYSGINYWFDQQKVRKAYTSGDIDCSELSNGLHAVHFQLIDNNGLPCPVQTQFFVNVDFGAQQLYYWFDDATARSLMDIDGTEISVESLANGKHTLHAMLADVKGNVICPEQMSTNFTIVCPDGEHVDTDADGTCDVCDELLSYTRSTTADRYGTICLPKSFSVANITGATIYSLAGKRVDDMGNPTSLVLEEVSEMEAGKPYIFLANGSEMNIVYSGEAVTEAGSSNGLVGSFTGCSVAEGMYLLSSNQIVKCGTGCSIGANRAYINMGEVQEYVDGSVSPAKMAVIGLDGTDGVSGVSIEGDAVRHNLSGIRVPSGTKGIIIVNGKKVVSK